METVEGRARPFLSGIILAAGVSSRMGRPKQLLPLRGRPLLQHVLDAVADSCLDEIIIVLGHAADEIRGALQLPSDRPARIVLNADHALGQSTSLRAGLLAADPRAEAVAVVLGDQPHVTAGLINTVAAAFLSAQSPVARPVHLTADGRRTPGHPVFLSRQTWTAVEALRGDEGARSLLADHPEWLLEVPIAGEPPRDIDTWADYSSTPDS